LSVPTPYVYNAAVTRVVDGDTLEALVSFGFFLAIGPIPIRILGINARELHDPGGVEARDNLTGMLPPGTPIVLHTAKPDKFAPRWDALIETAGIPDLSGYLIAQQWAAAYFGAGTKNVAPWPRTIGDAPGTVPEPANDGAPLLDGLDVRWGEDWRYIVSLYPDTEPFLWSLASALWDQGARDYANGGSNPFWRADPQPRDAAAANREELQEN
jgi:hypothetical protein